MNFSKLKIGDIIYSIKARFAERADVADRADVAAEAENVKGVNVEGYVQNAYYSARSGIANSAEYVEGSNVDGSVTHAYLSDLAGEAEKVDGINVVGAVNSAVNAQKSTTQAKTDNSDNIATTEYVKNNLDDYVPKSIKTSEKITFTPTSGTSYPSFNGCFYYKIGSRVHLHIGISELIADTRTQIFIMPNGFRPTSNVVAAGMGSSLGVYAQVQVGAQGTVYVRSENQFAMLDIEYDVFTS